MGIAPLLISQILILLFVSVPVAICIRSVYLAVTRPKNHSAEPACERCRYRVSGLNILTCPECGTDLRRTGIITPAMEMRRRGSTVGAVLAWTFIIGAAGLLAVSASGMLMARQFTRGGGMRSASTFTPGSLAYAKVEVSAAYSFGVGPPMASETLAKLTDSAGEEWTLSVVTGACTTNGPRGGPVVTNGPCDVEIVKGFFARAGVDTANAAVAKEAAELVVLITAQAAAPTAPVGRSAGLTAFTLSGFATQPVTPAGVVESDAWVGIVIMVGSILLFALWVAGVVFIVVRRGTLMREAKRYDWADRAPGLASEPVAAAPA
ncbi:MAG: hypothetical protein ACT4PL_14580 [Phycisphaerales bacterium]